MARRSRPFSVRFRNRCLSPIIGPYYLCAPHNFAALRKFALALLRQDTQYPKRSLRSRRKTAERLPNYRASLLGLRLRG